VVPGSARDETQSIAVSATGGRFLLLNEEAYIKSGGSEGFAFFEWNATAAEVQTGLEELYGAGNVTVSGGPGDETGSKPYLVMFVGALAAHRVPLINGEFSAVFLECGGAPKCTGTATIGTAVESRPDGYVVVTAANLGNGLALAPVTITDQLPGGLVPVSIEGLAGLNPASKRGPMECELASLSCTFTSGTVPPLFPVEMVIGVNVSGPVSGENRASVSGGGAAEVSVSRKVAVSGTPGGFGVEQYSLDAEDYGGGADRQAGSHPFQLTTTLSLNQTLLSSKTGGKGYRPEPVAPVKDLHFKWPAGLIGDPSAMARCSTLEFLAEPAPVCKEDTVVGVARAVIVFTHNSEVEHALVPLYNIEPNKGEPARFAFKTANVSVYIDPSVRTGSDYGVTVSVDNVTQTAATLESQVTVWGVPGDSRHDSSRGSGCMALSAEEPTSEPCSPAAEAHPPALLSMPGSCTGPLPSVVEADSWVKPSEVLSFSAEAMPGLDGCNRLPFTPSIEVKPDVASASTSTGLTVDVHVPQEETLNANGLAEGEPRGITVALPEGVAVNPSGGDGLLGCSEQLAGFTGFAEHPLQPGVVVASFTETLPEPPVPGVNFCPDASKIGTVRIKTPILHNPLEGAVYLASQNTNPFGSLIATYLIAQDPESGVAIKLAGVVHLSPAGQLVATFENSPQAPFEDAELHFFGGERAPLATPAHCGPYETKATLTPWSAEPNEAPRPATSTFNITSGLHGGACPGAALPFSPSLTSGPTNINAGSFSALTTTIGREDGQQDMQSVQLHMPPGLSGILAGVKLCPEQNANEGTCGPESLVGETTVSAGVGSDPVSVVGGRVYLTEKYAGAPFGLSIVDPVKAGPFDLEHDTANPSQTPLCDCVVVRAKIEIDPRTAALTITTDPSGPHAIPHVIDGIPVQIQKVNVLVNRPGFTFNPTNCNPMSITATITSAEGTAAPVVVPFQIANCANLKFTPKLTVSTAAHTSKANGSSLVFKISYPKNALGSQSWFNEAKFDLPKQLPARLTTLQKACLANVFEANPQACPAGSLIGHAVVHTPVLPVPLTGPVYFVSHGGAKFPDAVLLLKGYGVTVSLVGETFINNKTGITSATFRNTPDVPFQSIEVTLPSGPYSEFGSNLPPKAKNSFCNQTLTMPTFFKAQNGQTIKQTTKLTTTGCKKHHKHHIKHR
jgi:hypothetical protein